MWPFKKKAEQVQLSKADLAQTARGEYRSAVLRGDEPCGITSQYAETVPAYSNAKQLVAGMFAVAPWKVYNSADKSEAPAHPVYDLLHNRPNPMTSPYKFKYALAADAFEKSGYAEIVRDGAGRPRELWNVPYTSIEVVPLDSRRFVYNFTDPITGERRPIQPENMFHLAVDIAPDGVCGKDRLAKIASVLRLAKATEYYLTSLFANNCKVGGKVKFPLGYDADAAAAFMDGLKKDHRGAGQAYKYIGLEDGIEIDDGAAPDNESTQVLELRRDLVYEVARNFNVSPVWLQDLSKATWSNLGDLYEHLIRSTLLPYFTSGEEEGDGKLFMKAEAGRYFCEFNLDVYTRGNTAERYEAYLKAVQGGWLDANAIKEKENIGGTD